MDQWKRETKPSRYVRPGQILYRMRGVSCGKWRLFILATQADYGPYSTLTKARRAADAEREMRPWGNR